MLKYFIMLPLSTTLNQQYSMLEKLSPESKFQLLGEITALMMSSPLHSKYTVGDVTKNFLPPLDLGQFRIYKKGKTPIALLTWAYLDDETSDKYANEQYDLQLGDWNKGKNLWFIDFIATQNVIKEVEYDMKHNLFPNETGKALRADKSGMVSHIQEYFGINYQK